MSFLNAISLIIIFCHSDYPSIYFKWAGYNNHINPQFFLVSGGTPTLIVSVGNPWSASYIMGM